MAPAVPVEHVALPATASGDGPQVVGELTGGEESAAALEQLLDRPADMSTHLAVSSPARGTGSWACRRSAVYPNATSAVATSNSSPIV